MGFRKTVQTLLGLPVPKDPIEPPPPPPRCRRSIHGGGGGLRIISGEVMAARNVVTSSAVGSAPRPDRIDPGARGLQEPADDRLHLGMCTESLGFESLDGSVGEDLEPSASAANARIRPARSRRRRGAEPREFPPPLPHLLDGRRTSFMRATRRDGRILITEVTIERPEVLRASRSDGRLRLDLVRRFDAGSGDPDPDPAAVVAVEEKIAADPDPVVGAAEEEIAADPNLIFGAAEEGIAANPDLVVGAAAEEEEGENDDVEQVVRRRSRRPWERIQPAGSARCQEAMAAAATEQWRWGRSSFVTPA